MNRNHRNFKKWQSKAISWYPKIYSCFVIILQKRHVLTFQIYLEKTLKWTLIWFQWYASWVPNGNVCPVRSYLVLCFFGHFRSWKCIFHKPTQTYAVRIDWYHSNWLDELIRMFPSVSLVSISQCQKSRIKVLKFRKKQSVKIRVQNFWVIVHDLDYQLLWLYKNVV